MKFASGSSITLSAKCGEKVLAISKLTRQISASSTRNFNHPELVRRLGIIGINTALEFDIYGNVNSTHVW